MGTWLGGVVAVAVVLATAACADPDGGQPFSEPADDPPTPPATAPAEELPGDLRAACGAVEFATVPADWSTFPPMTDVASVVDLDAIAGEREFFDDYDWYIAAENDHELTLFGEPAEGRAAGDPSAPHHAYAAFGREDDRWRPEGWGQCRIELDAPGWGNARFVLDPDIAPDPTSTTVDVLAWENDCANGEPPGDRPVKPVVLTDDQTVSLVVLVEPVSGGAECPSNPSFPLRISLDGPLGERTIVDASTQPPYERPWPPTRSSLDSDGLTG